MTIVGNDDEAKIIGRAWSAVNEQALDIKTISIDASDDSNGTSLSRKLIESAAKSDLILYPLYLVADLFKAEAIVPLSEEQFKTFEEELGVVYPAVRGGAARYAGEFIAMPIGAPLPSLLTTTETPDLWTWNDYHRWVQDDLMGDAAEPQSVGYAGTLFLYRAITSINQGWLFSREGFVPIIDSDPYVDVLSLMQKTAAAYNTDQREPESIARQIASGKLKAAINFPMKTPEESKADLSVSNLPTGEGNRRMMLAPFSPIASLSTNCRQSAATKRLMNWLAGGEGMAAVDRQIPRFTSVRKHKQSGFQTQAEIVTAYDAWLAEQLETPTTAPALQLLGASRYLSILDEGVRECLEGKTKPKEALSKIAKAWDATTVEIGRAKQESAWRQAQGLRA